MKNDYLFKRMFGEEESKPVLIGLLNGILDRADERRIEDLTVLGSKRLTRRLIDDKEGVLDIHCKTGDREQFNIEMQVCQYPDMEKRSMFYVAKLFVDSIKRGQKFNDLKKTIGINLLDYSMLPLSGFHHTFHLYEDRNRQYMLTDPWKQELTEMDPLIGEAEERLTELSLDEETRLFYEAREKGILTTRSMLHAAREEGKADGLAQAALNLLHEGVDLPTVARCTGLSEEQLRKLK